MIGRVIACAGAGLAGWLALPVAPAYASGCEVSGVVQDADGVAIAGIGVALSEGSAVTRTSTDREGRYRFPGAGRQGGALTVSLVVADAAHDPAWFSLYHERREVVIASDTFSPDGGCERNFDFRAIDDRYPEGEFPRAWWADVITLYRGFSEALSLSARLGIDLGRTPLEIQVFYPAASPDTTFWVGTPSFAPDSDRLPYIGLGVHASLRADDGWPGNREDHEIGHHVLARGFGGVLPRSRNDLSGGGYWANPTSADAWAEGFASFYAVMVAKHVRSTARPHWLRIGGAMLDLELDYRPWDLGGLEEIAVAGVLLDLEDGPGDYATDAGATGLTIVASERIEGEGWALIAGQVAGGLQGPTVVDLELLDEAGGAVARTRTVVVPEAQGEQSSGRFAAWVPDGVAASTARLATHPAQDDDPVDLALDDIWRAIADFTSTKPESHGRLFDVEDLHAAMKKSFGGKDADGNGIEDIDQLFIAHGLFQDANGNRRWDEGEIVGQTGHPGGPITIDGVETRRPDLSPRHRVELPAALRAEVELTGAQDPTLVVLAHAGERPPVAYMPTADAAGRIAILPPPAAVPSDAAGDAQASVSILALAPGEAPVVVARLDATQLLADIERRTVPFLSLSADLAALQPDAVSAAEDLRVAWGIFVGGSVTLLFGLGVLVLGIARGR